jgi:hypothetical protein
MKEGYSIEEISMANIFISTVIDAPVSAVWLKIRDFNALPQWNPAIATSSLENNDPSDRIGCIRNLTLQNGGKIREQLIALSDLDYSFSYSILASPMPFEHYVATVTLKPITDGDRTYAEWSARFECEPRDEENLVKSIGEGVFLTGFQSLNRTLGTS